MKRIVSDKQWNAGKRLLWAFIPPLWIEGGLYLLYVNGALDYLTDPFYAVWRIPSYVGIQIFGEGIAAMQPGTLSMFFWGSLSYLYLRHKKKSTWF